MWPFRSALVLFIYTGLNIYTGVRVLSFCRFLRPSIKAFVFWPLYGLFAYSFILDFFFQSPDFLRRAFLYGPAVFVYLLLSMTALDLLSLGVRLIRRGVPDRRLRALGAGLALCLTLGLIVYGHFHARDIRAKGYEISITKGGLAEGGMVKEPKSKNEETLRIALISDIHLGLTVDRKWTARIVDETNRTSPDLICVAGDIVNNDLDQIRDIEGISAEFRRFKAPLGVYACLGNHYMDRLSLRAGADPTGTARIEAFLKDANIILLQDESRPVGDKIIVAGRRDARPIGLRQSRKSIEELSAAWDASKPVILLDHQPLEFSQAAGAGVDLYLSGHTHQGQFFPGNLITRRIYEKAGAVHYGYWRGGGLQAIVTSGAGLWGPPIRVATNAEIAVIDVKITGAP